MKVGIIGAGIAGLACAERLAGQGIAVALFDKGRRPGGRLSTLHLPDRSWDYGAQYFTVRDPRFARAVAPLQSAGRIAPWLAGPAGALVGVPGMASLVEALGAPHRIAFATRIDAIQREDDGWWAEGEGTGFGPFDALVVALPAEQAAPLLAIHDLALAREAVATRSLPCWAVMAGFDRRLEGLPDYLRNRGAIAWAARNASKPGRPPAECWVIQATHPWSQRHLEAEPAVVAQRLLDELRALGPAVPDPAFLKAHRWRFALATGSHDAPLWNPAIGLGACGDWRAGPRIEDAWLSGTALADRMIATLASGRTPAPFAAQEA